MTEINCPSCGSVEINMVDSPIVIQNHPFGYNWYGQCHRVKSTMVCETCGVEFLVIVSAYKNRASVVTEIID